MGMLGVHNREGQGGTTWTIRPPFVSPLLLHFELQEPLWVSSCQLSWTIILNHLPWFEPSSTMVDKLLAYPAGMGRSGSEASAARTSLLPVPCLTLIPKFGCPQDSHWTIQESSLHRFLGEIIGFIMNKFHNIFVVLQAWKGPLTRSFFYLAVTSGKISLDLLQWWIIL